MSRVDPRAMSCEELAGLVTEYLEGALSEEEAQRFEQHLLACDGCDVYLAQFRRTISAVGRVPLDDAIGAPARDRLLEAFRGWKRGGS